MKYELAFKILIIMSIVGGGSSFLGGLFSCFFSTKNKKIIASLYEVTAGIMTAIVCFDMIPESVQISNIFLVLFGIIIGTSLILVLDSYIQRYERNTNINITQKDSLVIMISMAFHNLIEGIAIGSSFCYSFSLGLTVLISMILHDIPEGMVVGIITKVESKNNMKTLKNSFLSGVITGLGALVGYILGEINGIYISLCLSVAAGCMLYIVSCDLIPNSKYITKDKKVYLVYIVGILIGLLMTKI